jgi:hypothetical protein
MKKHNNTEQTPDSKDIELRSEKVRNLLGEIPPSLIRWGTIIIIVIFLALMMVVSLVLYTYPIGESILQYLLIWL